MKAKGFSAVHFKWPGYFDANYDRILEFLREQGITGSNEEAITRNHRTRGGKQIPESATGRVKELLPEKWKSLKDLTHEELITSLKSELKDQDAETLARRLLGPTEFRSWQKRLVIHLLSKCHSILLDLRDFGMKDVRAMNTDLAEIQWIWQRINDHLQNEQHIPNMVFVLQKELAFSGEARAANYFLGKARTFEIAPIHTRRFDPRVQSRIR